MTTTIIDYEHQRIHLGWGFTVSHIHRNIDQGESGVIVLKNDSDIAIPHLRQITITSNRSPMKFCIHEDIQYSELGTLLPARQNNRWNQEQYIDSSLTAYCTPPANITDWGTEIDVLLSPEEYPTTNPKKTGFSGTHLNMVTEEWILNPNMNYALCLTNEDGDGADISWNIFWYFTDDV